MKHYISTSALLLVLLGACGWSSAEPLPITPFQTANRSPLVQIFGLPSAGSASILATGRGEGGLSLDMASNYAKDGTSHETIILDGEAYRLTLAGRYGIRERFEAGVELPMVGHGGGVSDGFIEGWHDFFGLPQGGRKEAPRNRLLYRYARDGKELLRVDDSSTGIGDLRLTGGYQLYKGDTKDPVALALRGSLKLPTGSSSKLHGSGSTDGALWLTASNDYPLSIGHLTLFGAGGGMAMTKGDILPDQQRSFVGFGNLGIGWAPADWIAFILEISSHTPFYKGSDLKELSSSSFQLHSGGTLRLSDSLLLDIDVAEDIAVNTAPDVTLHLAIRRLF
jgi:hypothetical protein